MAEPFVGEIRMFGGNFAPRSWAFCDGQLLAIAQNDALFSLLGTIYGGDGRTTFALPDLRGRVPVHPGDELRLGQRGGVEQVTLQAAQLPAHSHDLGASSAPADTADPAGARPAEAEVDLYGAPGGGTLSGASTTPVGGAQGHENLMPFQCVHFIIALFGIYPSRN